MNFNKTILMGNLTKDTELKYLPSGDPICVFSLAVNDGYGEKKHVSYFDVKCFKKQAENCNEYLSKGSPVLVDGRLSQSRWDAKDGTKRSKIEIIANSVIFLSAKPTQDEPF